MGLLTPLAIRLGGAAWLPRLLPQIVWVDELIQRASRGRLTLLDIAGLPNLVMTVSGRRSGVARNTSLLCVPCRGRYLIAGSYFGGPKQPAWVVNLEFAGHGTLRFGGASTEFTSRRLEGSERVQAWGQLLETWPNFAKYQQRTDREIKVFELTPSG